MKTNELSLRKTVKQELRQIGYPIIRDEVLYKSNPRKISDIVAYTISEEGNLIPEVVVEIKDNPAPGIHNQLQEAVIGVGSKYALLAVGNERYWYNSETFLPVEQPKVVNTQNKYLVNKEDIIEQISVLLREMPREMITTYEKVWVIGYSLIIRLYLHQITAMKLWRELIDRGKYIDTLEKALSYFNLNQKKVNNDFIRNVNADFLVALINLLDELPPENPILGEAFLSVISNDMISSRNQGQFVTPSKVRDLIRIVVKSINSKNCDVIDLTTGIGAVLFDVTGVLKSCRAKGLEINSEIANLAKMVILLAKRQNVEIICQDALSYKENTNNLVICDPPFGGKIDLSKSDNYQDFKAIKEGKRTSAEISELFIEKAINLANPGANIIILVAEGVLFRSPSNTRDLIRDKTYIEGIISLPPHTYKPYSAVKTSLLILRKKKAGEPIPENLFLGNPQSLENIEEVGELFVEWKKGAHCKQ
jgi:type I restriction-modification system DNA methylase subunit